MSIINPVQFYDATPAFAAEDLDQYHEAFYEVPRCALCDSEPVNVIKVQYPINGKRIFGVHSADLNKLDALEEQR